MIASVDPGSAPYAYRRVMVQQRVQNRLIVDIELWRVFHLQHRHLVGLTLA